MNVGMHPLYPPVRFRHNSLGQNEGSWSYPTEAAGPGHEGSGSVVVPPYYAPHQKHHPHLHSRPPINTSAPGHHHPQQQQQQQPAGMRVSPAPPPTAGPQNSPLPHSPHMSPAVGGPGSVVMPPHPGSGQNENRNNMHAPGYPPGGPPHMPPGPPGPPHGYPSKMGHMPPGPPGPPYSQPGYQQGPGGHQYPPARPQSHMMQGYPQNYPPGPGGPQGPPTSMPPGHQYAQRPPHNSHGPPNQPYGYSHFGQQGWGQGMGQPSMMGGMPGKGGPNQMPGQPNQPPGANSVGGPRPHTPPHNYLKTHLQHKMGGYTSSPPGPQMYPNGPGLSPGPPGPPPSMVNSRDSPQNSMPPPTSTPQPLTPSSSMVDGEHPPHSLVPPCNTTNSTVSMNSNNINSINSNPPQIGPDGNPVVDEASQQSTVSNTSAASGEDRSCTPKPHKEGMMGVSSVPVGPGMVMMGGPPSHPPPHPNVNSAPSPGTVSMTSQQDDFDNMNSPGWPRSPTTGPPVGYANSQPPPPPEIYRTAKDQKIHVSKNEIWTSKNSKKNSHKSKNIPGDSILRLYEMSDSPERRAWLDKLLRFMEDNKTPITACPTISKNPLDLYALYLHVRERGGFEEVTKNKQWKDVAAVMGIGASSSGSYTLRRHYMKHVLAYECKFDRGGIDPQPIINLIESSQKKKNSKTLSVPSPGSNSSSMDGFSNGPHMGGGPGMPGPYPQYPPGSEFPGHMQQRAPNPSAPGYQNYQGNQYPGYQGMHGGYPPQGGYPNSGFPPDGRGYQPGPPNHQGNYPGYQHQQGYPRPGFPQPPPPPPPQQGPYPQEQYPMSSNVPQTSYGTSQLAKQLLNPPPRNNGPGSVMQPYPGPGGTMYPGPPGPPQKPGAAPSPGPQPPNSTTPYQGPRRHPDFDKGQPGWRPPSTQYGFGSQGPPGQPGQPGPLQQPPWPRPSDSGPQPGPPQWSQPRYPPPPAPSFPNQQPRWSSSFGSGASGPRPPPVVGPGNKNYLVPPATSFKSGGYGTYMGKQLFPMDSVEAVSPILVKRKRMAKADVSPVDPWRLLMSLRCGLANEVTWALDILNILLFDDQTVVYFGLHHMPGLLEALIEHLRRGLINMFNICSELELGMDDEATGANKRIKAEQHDYQDRPWYEQPPPSPALELDLGRLEDDTDHTDKDIYLKGTDYTLASRTGKSVRFVKREAKIFMKEGTREWDKWEGFDSGIDTWSVGGGECTAHIICSMQSSVPPLPYTRLIPGKNNIESKQEKMAPNKSVKTEFKNPIVSECIIKIEKVDIKVTDCVETKIEPKVVPVVKNEQKTQIAKDKEPVTLISDKCNGPKETSTKSLISQKLNRKNNTKSSKLDDILKRIKKEPMGSSCVGLSIFNKNGDKSASQTDSKSILDQILKKDQDNYSDGPIREEVKTEMPEPKPSPKPSSSETKIAPPKPSIEKDQLQVCVESKVKTPIKSPTKLLAISPNYLANKNSKDGSGSRRDSSGFKRPFEDLEEESWGPDEASLSTTTEGQDWLAKRVMVVGTVIRNLSFIPGNEDILSKNAPLLALLGKTILLHHDHPKRSPATAHYDRDEEMDFSDWCSSLAPDTYWWWPYLHHVHENTLVTLANISGHLDLSYYPEEISRPILNGLLHWATCPASYGQDTLPGGGGYSQSALSPQRLSLEALVKLCVLDSNTDLLLATPPFSRLDMLCSQLTRLLCRGEDQVLREFAVNLFHYFSVADSGVARVIAMQNGCVSLLVAFIEEAESAALNVANVQGVSALKENPELMGTSLDMVRRSANTLVNLSRVPDNARVIAACENRFLNLVMSQILDTYVASQLSQVLFNVAQVQSENSNIPSPPLSPSAFMVMDGKEDEPSGLSENKPNIAQPVNPETEDTLPNSEGNKTDLKSETIDSNNSPSNDSNKKESSSVVPVANNDVPSPTSISPSSTPNNNTSAVSTSSCSSPLSVTSHPPLSPSLPHAAPCTNLSINSSSLKCENVTTVDTKAAPQMAPTL